MQTTAGNAKGFLSSGRRSPHPAMADVLYSLLTGGGESARAPPVSGVTGWLGTDPKQVLEAG